MLVIITTLKTVFDWSKRNIKVIIPTVLLVGMILFHFFFTQNPPLNQAMVISPITNPVTYKNGDKGQAKAHTPATETPEQAGFSKEFVKDTVNKIMGIKDKEILAINQIKGKYIDSLTFVKEELDEKQRKIKYYESKDRNGRVIGSGTVVEGDRMVYTGDVDVTAVLQKARNKKSLDTLKFYDPTQRFTVNQSKEFTYPIPKQTVKQRVTFSVQTGAGIVIPSFDAKRATFGGYVGGGVSYNF